MASEPDLKKSYFHISTFEQSDADYTNNPDRKKYYEIYWVKGEKPLHFMDNKIINVKGDWMYLVPPFRNYSFKKNGKNGILIAFNKDILMYEAKEFSLSVFNLFSRHGEFSTVFIDEETSGSLHAILRIFEEEFAQKLENILLLRTLLKAFLLKLMANSTLQLVSPDLDEKRVYHFLLLLENHYKTEKKVDFYAEKLNLSSKRLNQILKQKIGQTINHILQERLLIEAKHLLFVGNESIKEIAFNLGFEDSSYFGRFFKKMTKLSPEEFRKETKKEIEFG